MWAIVLKYGRSWFLKARSRISDWQAPTYCETVGIYTPTVAAKLLKFMFDNELTPRFLKFKKCPIVSYSALVPVTYVRFYRIVEMQQTVSHWFTDWFTNSLVVWLIDWLIDVLIDWLIDWWIDGLIDWWIDWLIDWLIENGAREQNENKDEG